MNIIELELHSTNIAETEKFYRKVLGLIGELHAKDEIYFYVGSTKLIFREEKKADIKPVYHFAIDVPNNRFEEAYNKIKAQVQLLPVSHGTDVADFKNWDAKSFYFLDNNQNIVEIITRYSNREFSDEPFSGRSYISVSEIGIVTGNVPELADRIKTQFDVPVFHRQPRGDKFTVCGDDEGLFILAEKGRDWYPTNIKSHSFYTRVLFYHNGVIDHIVR
jgi:catechol 2,3-dioxygenase-like lactoylglutathione lyase family enzyme